MAGAMHCTSASVAQPPTQSTCDACRIIMVESDSPGSGSIDRRIRETQARAKGGGPGAPAQIERLGWLFVEKARVANDPGYYKLAEQCALCLEATESNSLPALLLKGHVLHSLHRFRDAQPLAQRLVKERGMAADFGLLGDVEYDQGRIPEAVAAYQKMVNLRPELQSYSRVAQVRWITGDVEGAVEAMKLAADAGSPANAEPTAWTYSRLALLQLQTGDLPGANQSARRALSIESNSAPALLALGRIQWAAHESTNAIASLQAAVNLNPLPESQWLLADFLRADGRADSAAEIEKALVARGAAEDPRSFALFLATRGLRPELALKLAERELETRQDVFTHDALAWAFHAGRQTDAARDEMNKALAENTRDGRLSFHAAMIFAAAGHPEEASRQARRAYDLKWMLFPSELEQLARGAPGLRFSQQTPSQQTQKQQ